MRPIIVLLDEIEDMPIIELTCSVEMEDDSFTHEFGTEVIPPYPICNSMIYDKSMYNEDECKIIDSYISDNRKSIEEKACSIYLSIIQDQF
jgi:hypothetical protein